MGFSFANAKKHWMDSLYTAQITEQLTPTCEIVLLRRHLTSSRTALHNFNLGLPKSYYSSCCFLLLWWSLIFLPWSSDPDCRGDRTATWVVCSDRENLLSHWCRTNSLEDITMDSGLANPWLHLDSVEAVLIFLTPCCALAFQHVEEQILVIQFGNFQPAASWVYWISNSSQQ